MLSLSRSLFDNLHSLHRELDSLFDRTWGSSGRFLPSFGGREVFYPELECYTKDGSIVYRMAIPGVDPQKVDLSVVGNQLTVKGERSAPAEIKDENWYVREFRYGQFERTFSLPEGVETDKINATFNNGVLEISVPADHVLPRKIEVKQLGTGEQKPQLKATA